LKEEKELKFEKMDIPRIEISPPHAKNEYEGNCFENM